MFIKQEEALEILKQVSEPITWAHLSEVSADSNEIVSQTEAGGLDNVGFLLELFTQSNNNALLVLHRKDWLEIKLVKVGRQLCVQVTVFSFPDGIKKESEVNSCIEKWSKGFTPEI